VRQRKRAVFSTTRLIFAVLGAAVVSLASAIVGMFVARAQLLEASEWVRHTSDVELAVATCRIDVREAQVNPGSRQALLEQARIDIDRIRLLTVDNPSQQRRVGALVPLLQAFGGSAAEASQIDDSLRELEVVESALKDVRMMTLQRATRMGWVVSSASAALTVILVALMLGTLRRQAQMILQVHANLRREAAMLASVLDSMVDGIMAVTPSRTFLHVNRAARRLLGDEFPSDEFPKDWRSKLECVYEDGSQMKPEEGALSRAIAGMSTDNLIYKTRQRNRPNDAGIWVSATGRPVRDSDGAVIAGVVALHDMTEERDRQDELRAMSMSDDMTRLHNRRSFAMLAEQHAPFHGRFAAQNVPRVGHHRSSRRRRVRRAPSQYRPLDARFDHGAAARRPRRAQRAGVTRAPAVIERRHGVLRSGASALSCRAHGRSRSIDVRREARAATRSGLSLVAGTSRSIAEGHAPRRGS
jgi:PAS domain-containing protein